MPNWEYFDRPATAVENNISNMSARADTALSTALGIVDDLGKFDPGQETSSAPNIELPPISIPDVVKPTPPENRSFGAIGEFDMPIFEDLFQALGITLADLEVDLPTFNAPIGALNLPNPPAPIDTSNFPTRPDLSTVVPPDAPSVALPELGDLVPLAIPTFTFPELPTFTASAPVFDGVAPSTSLNFSEPVYASEVLDDVKGEIVTLMQGGTGLPVPVQQALFDAARAREEQTALAAREDAFDTFAARGFAMPPGMLVKAVNAADEKARLAANSLERDILTKSAQWEIENLRFAVQQAMAYEGLLINKFLNAAQRSFEAARARVDADLKLYEAAVSLFNARQNAYQVAASVFKTLTDGALAKLEVFKAQIQGEAAKGQLNEQTVKVYQARLGAVNEIVELYKARMQGAQLQSDLNRNLIEGYKADVQAAGERVQAQKTAFDAYDTQVKGEGVKAQMYEAYARAFGETVRAVEAKANIKTTYLNTRITAIRASIEKFTATAQAERDRAQAQLAVIQARTSAFSADVSRYTAELNSASQQRSVELQVSEERLRNNLAYYEARLREYDSSLARAIQRVTLVLEAMKASGQITSSLAAGAMSAIHVQASMSGSGNVSDSVSTQTIISRQGADVA